MKKQLLLTVIAVVLTFNFSFSQDTISLILDKAKYHYPGSWDLNRIPNTSDHVIIKSGLSMSFRGRSHVKSITIEENSHLSIAAGSQLEISGSLENGIIVSKGAFFTNYGTVQITGTGKDGIHNLGQVSNKTMGNIEITGVSRYGFYNSKDDIFENEGSLTISNSTDDGVFNEGTLTNKSGAIINVTNSSERGFLNNTGDVFVNEGTLSIAGTGADGITNFGTTTNKTGASFNIDNAGRYGFYNSKDDIFDNFGIVNIDQSTDDGVFNEGTLTNKTGGTIDISNSSERGFLNNTGDVFVNEGTLSIAGTVDDGLMNFGSVTNQLNGQIEINNAGKFGFHNGKDDTFTNLGLLKISGSTNHAFENATGGVFTNNNLFKINGSIQGVASIGGRLTSSTPTSIFRAEGNLSLTGTLSIHADGTTPGTEHDQLQVAGTADITNAILSFGHKFSANQGDRIVLIAANTIAGTFNTSKLDRFWEPDYSVAGEAAIVYNPCGKGKSSGLWTGCAGDDLWSNPENWDDGVLPEANDVVTIPKGKTVVLNDGQTHSLTDLTLSANSKLIIEAGSGLIINGSKSSIKGPQADLIVKGNLHLKSAFSIQGGGRLINHGTLEVENSIHAAGIVELRGTLKTKINGPTTGGNSTYISAPQISFSSGTVLMLQVNYTPQNFDRIVLLKSDRKIGKFSTIEIPPYWELDYSVVGEVALVYNTCGSGSQTGLWTGCMGDNLWSNPRNWDNGAVPGPADDVVIDNGDQVVFNVPFAEAKKVKSIVISGTSKLTVEKGFTLNAEESSGICVKVNSGSSLVLDGNMVITKAGTTGIWNEGTISNNSKLNIFDSIENGISNTGMLNNNYSLVIKSSGKKGFVNQSTGIFENSGGVTIDYSGQGGMDNKGKITNNAAWFTAK